MATSCLDAKTPSAALTLTDRRQRTDLDAARLENKMESNLLGGKESGPQIEQVERK